MFAVAHFDAVGAAAEADAGGMVTVGADDGNVAPVDGGFDFDDAGLGAEGASLHVFLDDVDALHDDALALGEDLADLAAFAAVFAGEHLDGVVLAEAAHG